MITSLGMRVDLPRTTAEDQTNGCWWIDSDDTVTLRCPQCDRIAVLSEGHEVSKTGIIRPSMLCPHGCGFHRDIKLLEWGK